MNLEGRVALVTGAARRVGFAIARGLAEAGADIALHHHSSPELAEEASAEIVGLGRRAEIFKSDLTDPGQISKLLGDVEDAFGRLDILVNSAAVFERRPVRDITPEDWDHTLDLNLRGPFFCSQYAARIMERQDAGVIINISDVAAFQPWPGYADYCIAKAGLDMMTRVLARALAPEIRVNAVAPGPVLPPDDTDLEEKAALAERTALKRIGSPDDVVAAVLFLVESDYITGETIVVDGGKRLKG
jgi:NAD(P)-dependent dehydrogenase (short-subunit alcohol dehydrogenase family)